MASWLERPVVVVLAALLAAAVVALVIQQRDVGEEPFEITLAGLTPTPGGPIEVYVAGAVVHPGVYQLKDGDRAVDALFAAGGNTPGANLEGVNLAVRLHDEDQVLVPRVGQPAAASSGVISNVAGATKVNINTASASELDALPSIGEVYSQRIVDSRTRDGLFTAPEDLLAREVVPQATYERIRDLISTGP
jgi:competence protein ComEA